MNKVARQFKSLLGFLLTGIVCLLVWAYSPLLKDSTLTFKWEGFFADKINYRDVGASINECLGREVLKTKSLLRSSHFYSGWSCDKVGHPNVILSLDAYPAEGRKYYCRTADENVVGEDYQTKELVDLEFIETWKREPEMVAATCKNLKVALEQLKMEKVVLVHCEAGRDRTGAVSALLAAYKLEEKLPLTAVEIAALECDYRKSKSLKAEKYGRIEKFINSIQSEDGSVHNFLKKYCQF